MGRVNVKRLGILCCLVAAAYFAFRNLNLQDSFLRTKWFFEYRRQSSSNSNVKANDAKKLISVIRNVPIFKNGVRPDEHILQAAKCPLCFGTDLCKHVNNGALELESSQMVSTPGKPRKIAFSGALHTTNAVLVKTLIPSEFNLLDQHICLKAMQESNCDTSVATDKILSELNNLLSIEGIQQLHKRMKKTRSDIPVAICANDKLLSLLMRAFHENKDEDISEKEQLMLYSTLATNPELVVLKFLTKFFPTLPFPQYYGSCGRLFVVEGAVTPLMEYINEAFHIRASLGGQILQMVEDFTADEDSEWLIIFTDFSFDNLGVNRDGEVVIIDVEDMVIVDKMLLKSQSADSLKSVGTNTSHEPCNEKCLRLFTQQIMHSADSFKACASIPQYNHLMYATICQNILSYLDEHRAGGLFGEDSYLKSDSVKHSGLLHDVPQKDKSILDELLQECVQETAPGGRIQAAEELKDYLLEFFKDDGGDDDADDYEMKSTNNRL